MPKYMFRANYSVPEGMQGLIADGGTGRARAVSELVAQHGGTQEAFYFSFGDEDTVVIADLPDTVTAAALALAFASSGMLEVSTTVLLTPEEIDEAASLKVKYQAPGQATRRRRTSRSK